MKTFLAYLKAFFDSRVVWYSAFAASIFYVIVMVYEYRVEILRIDKIAAGKFGVKLSSEFGFFEILASAEFNYFRIFFVCLFLIFLPTIGLVHLVRKCITEERHVGWKRLGIVVPPILIIWRLFSSSNVNLRDFILESLLLSIIALIAISAARWVFSGFTNRENSE